MKLLRLLLVSFLLLLSIGYMVEILGLSLEMMKFPASVKLFLYGGLSFLVFWRLFKKRLCYAFSVFEHELTHVMVAKLFLLKTLHFEVSPRKHVEGQVVVGVEGRGFVTRIISVIFSLAPYYIPTLTLLAFLVYPLLGERMQPLFSLSSGLRPCIICSPPFWNSAFIRPIFSGMANIFPRLLYCSAISFFSASSWLWCCMASTHRTRLLTQRHPERVRIGRLKRPTEHTERHEKYHVLPCLSVCSVGK
jgi:hypothetical protein